MKPVTPAKARSSRARKWLLWGAGLIVFYTIFGFLILPLIIRALAIKQLGKELHREATIEKVRLNPYAMSLTIRGLKIKDRDNETLFAWDEFYANLQLASFFGHPWVFDEIALVNPYARLQVNKDYSLNISDILAAHAGTNAPPKKAAPSRPPAGRVRLLRVEGARLSATDLTPKQPFHRVIGPVKIALTDFHTDPESRNPHLFTGSTDTGETFSWNGEFSLDPIRAAGELSVENVTLNKFAPLYEDFVRFEIRDGVAGFHTAYHFEQSQAGIVAAVSNASFALRSFKLGAAGIAENLLELPEFSVSGVSGDLLSRRVEVGAVSVRGADLRVVRNKGAQFNVVEAAQPNPNQSAPGGILVLLSSVTNVFARLLSSTNLATGTVRSVDAQDCAVTLRDDSLDRPVNLRVDQINVAARNLSNRPDTNMVADLSLRWNTNGTVKTKLVAALNPLNADLDLQVNQLELAPLSPYLDSFVNVYVLGSKIGLDGVIRLRTEPGGIPAVTYTGNAALDDLNLVGSESSEDLLKWSSLRFDGIAANLNPAAVTVTNVTLKDLAGLVVMETNRTLNVMGVLRTNAADLAATTNAAPPAAGPPAGSGGSAIKRAFAQVKTLLGLETNNPAAGLPKVDVNTVTIENGELQFVDRSVTPVARASLQKVHGTIKDLSTEEMRRAQVHLETLAGGTGLIEITGQLNPLRAKQATEAKLSVKNVKLNPADPYSGKFLGYRLKRGELNVNVDYTISASQLKGRNLIVLDQVTLGDKVASPDATHMPVKLAIALLKDRQGKIEIDVPVEGNLDDPQFRFGKVIWHVIGNVFVKAITSPFALLGSLVGGGKAGEEMQFQEFAPGSAELDAAAREKLANVAKALEARPELQLEIEGNVEPGRDGEALRRAKLEAELHQDYWRSLRASAREKTKPADVVLTPEKRADLLSRIYRDLVKTNPPAPVVPASAPAAGAAPAAPLALASPSPRAATSEEKGAYRLMSEAPAPAAVKTVALPGSAAPAIPVAVAAGDAKPTPEQIEHRLLGQIKVSDSDLATLAAERARQVQTNLVQELHVAAERVLLSQATAGSYTTNGTRVNLQLR
ncbi:MAG TPA: DUF748 domain-containing protein [Candidatus Acidoferrum sp.]|jgi:hypothetical protein|nr:DUF748 domain-containing protein [Candidatus Acidoferrum sp.]